MHLFELTRSLMNVPSVSGNEEAIGFYLRDYLESLGWTVELQPVTENQNNVYCISECHAAGLALDAHGHGAAVY